MEYLATSGAMEGCYDMQVPVKFVLYPPLARTGRVNGHVGDVIHIPANCRGK